MATYTVKGGDSLSAIASRLKIKGGWQALYQANKNIISNPNLIRVGQQLSIPGSSGSSTKTTVKATLPPSVKVGQTVAKAVEDPTRQNFVTKYGTEESLRPTAAFMQMGEEQVNPEALRQAVSSVSGYDWENAMTGGWRTGAGMSGRTDLLNALERNRKEMVNSFIQSQNDLFGNWYNKEMEQYMTSKAPSSYQLSKFGITLPGGTTTNYTVPANKVQYQYNPVIDYNQLFRYGGYSRPTSMYGTITPIENPPASTGVPRRPS